MTAPLRVAILGTGAIATAHAEAFRALPDRFRLSVVCDLHRSRADELARGEAETETLIEAVLGRDDVDVVDICLPPWLHASSCAQALIAGHHVICEKPLAGTAAEVDELASLADRQGRFLLPVFQYRFEAGFRRFKRLHDEGLTGRAFVTAVETHWDRRADYYEHPWRGTKGGEVGGIVMSHAIHANDLACQIHGRPRQVTAHMATRVNEIETEDCAAFVAEMADGGLLTHSMTLGAAHNTSRLRFCFEHLTAESNPSPYRPGMEPWTFAVRTEAKRDAIKASLAKPVPEAHGFEGLLEAFHKSLDQGEPLPVTLDEARLSIALAEALYASAREGGTRALPGSH
ncbi:MAG: Gfo/Idh/MocA family protein [Geminicoccaceae bacterium]